jgi:hypothetical protein
MVSKKEDNDSVSNGEMKAQRAVTTRGRVRKEINSKIESRGREKGRESEERLCFDRIVGRKRELERYDDVEKEMGDKLFQLMQRSEQQLSRT